MSSTRLVLALTLTLSAVAAAACGTSAPATSPVGNTTGDVPPGGAVAVDPARLGALGLAAAQIREDDVPYWAPITQVAPVVVPPEAGLKAGTSYTVVPADGAPPADMRADQVVSVKYGCDDNATEMSPLDGPWLAPGVVWILPPDAPAAWAPAAEKLAAPARSATRAHWTAGPIAITVDVVDDKRATLTIRADGAAAHTEPAEAYFMEGAEVRPLELASDERHPGIPSPVAVFRVADAGPHLVVLDRSGYEGVSFETLLVGAGGDAKKVESMSLMLYYCAF